MTNAELLAIIWRLDEKAEGLIEGGADDVDLFYAMNADMGDVQLLLDHSKQIDLESVAEGFPSFQRYADVFAFINSEFSDGGGERKFRLPDRVPQSFPRRPFNRKPRRIRERCERKLQVRY